MPVPIDEIKAMEQAAKALVNLDDRGRARVLLWLNAWVDDHRTPSIGSLRPAPPTTGDTS